VNRRRIIVYWLLLLAPTACIGVFGFRLLALERERMAARSRAAMLTRAQTLADTLEIAVTDVKGELLREVRRIPREDRVEALIRWERSNPLVRNTFVWAPGGDGLVHPARDRPSDSEDRGFIARFDALFSGRVGWGGHGAERDAPAPSAGAAAPAAVKGRRWYGQQPARFQRRELLDLARVGNVQQPAQAEPPAAAEGGWIPWFAENRLHLLGWTRERPDGPVYGLELELMAVLSRLVTAFPAAPEDGCTLALLDGAGRVMHQTGDTDALAEREPVLDVSLATSLPHWRLAVYCAAGAPAGAARAFTLLAVLLLAILIAAILSGGMLLTLQARRSYVDARRKTSFVSNVSHELKTPLTSIRMYAELLSEGRVKGEEKARRYLEVIAEESRRLTRLVNNVLDFSRLEQRRKTYRPEELDAAAFVTGIVEDHRLRMAAAGLDAVVEGAGQPAWVRTDRDALEQALLNLVDNALKYAAEGKQLCVGVSRRGGWIDIRVSDRGPGVARAQRARIFEKFHRVDDSLTAGKPGSGLGLSIARSLLRDQGGDVFYEPRAGGGSTFVIRLPWRKDEA